MTDQLWAPWRLAYIKGDEQAALRPGEQPASTADDCFLCRYRDQSQDRQNLVVKRTNRTLVVLNRYPYNNGHLLIAPLEHSGELTQLSDEQLLACMQDVRQMTALLQKAIQPDGFNIGLNLGKIAGAGLPGHLHWHIVPRWNGDVNFMPVLANVKVIPQSLEALYDLLDRELSFE